MTEAIDIGRGSGVRVQFSHAALNDPDWWGRAPEITALFEQGRADGIDVGYDVYPYDASASNLTQYLPTWVMDGGTAAMAVRLEDADARRRAEHDLSKGFFDGIPWHWERVVVARPGAGDEESAGQTIEQLAAARRVSPEALVLDLCRRFGNTVSVVLFYRVEEDVRTFLAHPLAVVGSDGSALPLDQGQNRPHPRSFGCYPRLLGRFVREQGLMSLSEAVHKSTGAVADRLGLRDRGRITPGLAADLVLFDAGTVGDRATFLDPGQAPVGISHVLVNGRVVVRGGEQTAERPGTGPARRMTPVPTKGLPLDVVGTGTRDELVARGLNLDDGTIPTPFATLRRSTLHANLARMARYCDEHGVRSRRTARRRCRRSCSPPARSRRLGHHRRDDAQVRAWRAAWACGGSSSPISSSTAQDLRWAADAARATTRSSSWLLRRLVARRRADAARLVWATPATAGCSGAAGDGDPRRAHRVPQRRRGRGGDRRAVAASRASLELFGVECFEGIERRPADDARIGPRSTRFLATRARRGAAMRRAISFAGREIIVSAGGSGFFDLVVAVFAARPLASGARSCCAAAATSRTTRFYDALLRESPGARRAGRGGLAARAGGLGARCSLGPEPGLAILAVGKRDVSFDIDLPMPFGRASGPHDGAGARWRSSSSTTSMPTCAVRRRCGSRRWASSSRSGISHPCTTFDRWRWILVVDDDDTVVDLVHTWF